MTLAPDDALGGIIAATSCNADAARARGLCIHHRRDRRGIAPNPLAVGHGQRMSHASEGAAAGQAQEPAQHILPGREVARQVAPGAAGP
jgi:hypothetical protein